MDQIESLKMRIEILEEQIREQTQGDNTTIYFRLNDPNEIPDILRYFLHNQIPHTLENRDLISIPRKYKMHLEKYNIEYVSAPQNLSLMSQDERNTIKIEHYNRINS